MRHVLRLLIITLALALLALVLAPRAVPAQAAGPCDSSRTVPHWWHPRPLVPCAGDTVTLVFGSCRDCVDLVGYEWADRDTGTLQLDVSMPETCPATTVCTLDSLEVPIGPLQAGTHMILYDVNATVALDGGGSCTIRRHEALHLVVGCSEVPEPGPLPYVSTVQIGPLPPCQGCSPRICPYQPISLALAGWFTDGCFRLTGLELVYPAEAESVGPPLVRIGAEWNACVGCPDVIVPWAADTALGGLPGGTYALPLELALRTWCDSTYKDTTYAANVLFTVKDTCVTTTRCYTVGWDHRDRVGSCDAFVAEGDTATVGMTIATRVPLAGVQGVLKLYPSGLAITGLEPAGMAAGMHLTWEAFEDGAKFVMFADEGAPIVPVRCADGMRCLPDPVLEVELQPVAGAAIPPVTHLRATDMLASDSLGKAVRECPVMTLVVVEARICSGASCDFNGDGRLDVRDLVAMVHCVLHTGPCPDTTLALYDCNGDGQSGIDDVLCCARQLLHHGQRDTVPGRSEPDVTVAFGDLQWQDGKLRAPIHIEGADRLGAARLALALPLDRYDVAGVELTAADPRWLELHDTVGGQLVIGLIGIESPDESGEPTTLDLTLDLALQAGESAGGELRLTDLQASGPDGVTLELPAPTAAVTLPVPGTRALSLARPNPFASTTSVSLALGGAAQVDVAVHDLSGRRLATLFHGPLTAGTHEFTWNGRYGDRAAAPHGIYFVQARVNGERLTRKVVLLRGE